MHVTEKKAERNNLHARMCGFRGHHTMLVAMDRAVRHMQAVSTKKGRTRLENALAAAFYSWSCCPSATSDVLRKVALKELRRAGYKTPKAITIHQFEPK